MTSIKNIKRTFMKQAFFTVLLCSTVLASVAQSDKYAAAMKKTMTQMDSAKTVDDLQSAAGGFERIGDAEKTQWLPYYYAALCQTWVGWRTDVKDKDGNAEKIKAYLTKAEAIETNSELLAVENMMATQQMLLDPQTRWQTYGQQAGTALQKGMKLDPNNPRLYYLQGMSLFGTPPQFGGGKDKAKPLFEKAIALYKSAQPKPLYPTWGQKQTEDMLAQCQ
jgi:tetratricopeptide (TPR) repeat protein